MATTGPVVMTGPAVVTGTSVVTGQGPYPLLWALYSTDDVSVSVPTWQDATAKVRAFSTSRGRATELDDMPAGTASVTLDNRARTFDPVINTGIRPLNQWWLREQFTGETQDLFKGYAESYDQQWPDPSVDAITTVSCADEFKVLALGGVPTMSPPRNSYGDLVQFDNPSGYWPMDDAVGTSGVETAVVGANLVYSSGGYIMSSASLIVGGNPNPQSSLKLAPSGGKFTTVGLNQGDSGDVAGLAEFTVEVWLQFDAALPAVDDDLIIGPTAGSASTWRLHVNTGVVTIEARNSGATLFTASTGTLQANTPYHIVGTIESGFLRIYVNGVQASSTAWSGNFAATMDAGANLILGDLTLSSTPRFDSLATYRYGLTAARVSAHYTAGALRGFPSGQGTGDRINAVLDTVGSRAPRQIRTGTVSVLGVPMTGQAPLDEIRNAVNAEAVSSMFFTARDGSLLFLDRGHRGAPPWNAVQATFDDDGTDLPYHDLVMDFSEAFLANEWNVTGALGTTQTAFDTASISRYFKRSQSITGLLIGNDGDAATIASAMLVKYKDPFQRVSEIRLSTALAIVSEAAFRRDIGDRIEVFRTPPGGGARVDQVLFIQKIAISGNPTGPWSISWGVSPL